MVGILQEHHIDTHKHTYKIAEEKCPVLTVVGGIIEVLLAEEVLLASELLAVGLVTAAIGFAISAFVMTPMSQCSMFFPETRWYSGRRAMHSITR